MDCLHDRLVTRMRLRTLRGNEDIQIGRLHLKPTHGVAERLGRLLNLTPREFDLLAYLAAKTGQVISRKELNENVFEIDSESPTNLVDVYVGYLRAKIEFENEPKLLHTFRGRGYMLGLLED